MTGCRWIDSSESIILYMYYIIHVLYNMIYIFIYITSSTRSAFLAGCRGIDSSESIILYMYYIIHVLYNIIYIFIYITSSTRSAFLAGCRGIDSSESRLSLRPVSNRPDLRTVAILYVHIYIYP